MPIRITVKGGAEAIPKKTIELVPATFPVAKLQRRITKLIQAKDNKNLTPPPGYRH